MKNILFLLIFTQVLSSVLHGQENERDPNWILGIETGAIFQPNTEMTQNRFQGGRVPIGINAFVHYRLNEIWGLRASIFGGFNHGQSNDVFFEGRYGSGSLTLVLDALKFLRVDSRNNLEFDFGLGGMLFSADLYELSTRRLISRAPSPLGNLNPIPIINAGVRYRFMVYENLHFNVGLLTHFAPTDNRLDAFIGSERMDWLLTPTLGLSYSLSTPKRGEVFISNKDKLSLERALTDTEIELAKAQDEANLRQREINVIREDFKMEIDALTYERDSLAKLLEDGVQSSKPVAEAAPSDKKWLVIVGSYPSEAMARSFISETALDKSNMSIRFSEEKGVYRVIHSSFEGQTEALRVRDRVREVVSDAWILFW